MHNISVEAMIKYLKEWCVRPADEQELRRPGEDLEGADFTSTVQHISNVYNYLHQNCSKAALWKLFQHHPAVFIEYNRYTLGCTATKVYIHVQKNQSLQALIPPPSDETAAGVRGVSTT